LEQKVAERTHQLTILNKELETFSYSVSHDLRAPLRVVDGYSHALLEDYGDQFDEDGQYFLERIRAGTQRMGELIDDLLDLSRVTRADLQLSKMDFSQMAREVITELKAREPERQVEFVIQAGISVTGDERLLRIVLENLIGNAWKFTGKTGVARIEFGKDERQGKPCYFVRDNGAGFDMEYAGKLFGTFQRLHSEKEFEGTGIGLATVQRIIHRHGGDLGAEGAVGEGATFWFTLG
jgi:light-regulated signal transduction histidine kinase (bacteriophytochrome)